jgi:uncharacterized membrane protein YbhN (UPF0104 family)
VGIVEGILPFALNMLRVPLGASVLITLIYRAVTFWLPLLVGGVTFRILGNSKKLPLFEENPQENKRHVPSIERSE